MEGGVRAAVDDTTSVTAVTSVTSVTSSRNADLMRRHRKRELATSRLTCPIELSCESELDVLVKVSISLESEFDPENQFKGYPLEPKSDHLAPTWADFGSTWGSFGPLGAHFG